jgi:hypothetical protein
LGSGTFDLFLEVPDRNSQAMYHTTYISVPVTAGATFTLNVRSDTNFALQTTMDTPIAPTAIWTTTLRNLSLNVATPELAVGDLVAFKQAYFEARRGAVEWAKDAVIIGAHTWHTMGTAQTKREALNQDGKAAQWLFTVATTHKMSEIYVVNGIAGSVGIDGVPGNDFIFDEPLSPEWLKQQEIRADEVIDSEIVVRVVKQRDLGGWELTEMRLDGNQWRLHFESPQRSRYIVVNAKTGEVLSDTETSTS